MQVSTCVQPYGCWALVGSLLLGLTACALHPLPNLVALGSLARRYLREAFTEFTQLRGNYSPRLDKRSRAALLRFCYRASSLSGTSTASYLPLFGLCLARATL